MRFLLLFLLALSCCPTRLAKAEFSSVRGLQAGDQFHNSSSDPFRPRPPPPSTTEAVSTG